MIFMELFPCTNGSLLERIENHQKKLTVGSKRTRARTRVQTYKCLTVDILVISYPFYSSSQNLFEFSSIHTVHWTLILG